MHPPGRERRKLAEATLPGATRTSAWTKGCGACVGPGTRWPQVGAATRPTLARPFPLSFVVGQGLVQDWPRVRPRPAASAASAGAGPERCPPPASSRTDGRGVLAPALAPGAVPAGAGGRKAGEAARACRALRGHVPGQVWGWHRGGKLKPAVALRCPPRGGCGGLRA